MPTPTTYGLAIYYMAGSFSYQLQPPEFASPERHPGVMILAERMPIDGARGFAPLVDAVRQKAATTQLTLPEHLFDPLLTDFDPHPWRTP
jgi:hypothetical protein